MIRINLLPEELQRAASTARTIFAFLLGGVATTVICGFVLVFLYLNFLSLKDEVESRKIQVDLTTERAYQVDRINEDIVFYKEREKAIIEIKSQRILWSKKLAQLAYLTPKDIWITELSMKTLDVTEYKWDPKIPQTGGRVSLTCYAEGTEVSSLTDFRKALSGDQRFYKDLVPVRAMPDNFFGDFSRFLNPAWQVIELEGYQSRQNLSFTLDMDLRPLAEKPVVSTEKGK